MDVAEFAFVGAERDCARDGVARRKLARTNVLVDTSTKAFTLCTACIDGVGHLNALEAAQSTVAIRIEGQLSHNATLFVANDRDGME